MVHEWCKEDESVLLRGVKETIKIMDHLKDQKLVGERMAPSYDITTDEQFVRYIKSNAGTAYHWMSTCKCGKNGTVGDEDFKLRGVHGVRIGSGASLPEIPVGNPHLTINAFSVALVYKIISQHQHQSLIGSIQNDERVNVNVDTKY